MLLRHRSGGMPVLELTATGHRSGQSRTILIWYLEDAAGPIMAGTNAGADYDPAWVTNLRANPTAQTRLDRTAHPVEARFLEGSGHEAAWSRFLEANEAYGSYRKLLEPCDPARSVDPGELRAHRRPFRSAVAASPVYAPGMITVFFNNR